MTHRLPRELSRPIYNEFQNRFQESVRIIEKYPNYQILKDDLGVVEVLLALLMGLYILIKELFIK